MKDDADHEAQHQGQCVVVLEQVEVEANDEEGGHEDGCVDDSEDDIGISGWLLFAALRRGVSVLARFAHLNHDYKITLAFILRDNHEGHTQPRQPTAVYAFLQVLAQGAAAREDSHWQPRQHLLPQAGADPSEHH